MRRYFTIFAALFAFVGCSQDDVVTPNAPIEKPTYYASFADAEADSRTYLDENFMLLWHNDDRISLFATTYNEEYAFADATGNNSGAFNAVDKDSYVTGNAISTTYAVYPYNAANAISNSEILTIHFPAEQSYAEDSFGRGANTMVAAAQSSSSKLLPFRNAGGYMMLKLYGENKTVKSIELKGNNEEVISGAATAEAKYGYLPLITMGAEGGKSITLTCENAVELGATEAEATTFWIVVPPITFEEGFTITVTDADGGTYTKSTSKPTTINRNEIKSMSALTPTFTGETENPETPAKPANNEIWYTAIAKVDITIEEEGYYNFGTKLVSHEYDSSTQKGVIKCESDILHIARAFTSNDNLISINIPDCVNNFDSGVLLECKNLKTIISKWSSEDRRCLIQDNYLKAFAPAGLTEYTLPNGIENIANSVFRNCSDLTKITIPESVTTIYDYAFGGCSSLESITIPNSVSIINNTTFSGCTALKDVIIGSGVTTIGNRAFNECSSLKNINIPDNVTTIDPTAFLNSGLTSINGKYASTDKRCWIVDGCVQLFASAGLTEYTIPDSATSIDNFAFYFAVNLTSITIPDSVTIHTNYNTSSVYNPFGGCRSLQMFNGKYASASKQYLLSNDVLLAVAPCSELTEFIVPAGVVYVANDAFVIDNSLESITIPGSVKVLNSIKSCTNLKSLYINSTTPPAIGYIQLPENCIAYVPREAVDTYKSARGWSLNEAKIQPYDF